MENACILFPTIPFDFGRIFSVSRSFECVHLFVFCDIGRLKHAKPHQLLHLGGQGVNSLCASCSIHNLFVYLVHRKIPSRENLQTCFYHWHKSRKKVQGVSKLSFSLPKVYCFSTPSIPKFRLDRSSILHQLLKPGHASLLQQKTGRCAF